MRSVSHGALALLLFAAGPVAAAASAALAHEVERTASKAALEHVAAPDRLEILSSRFGGADPVGASAVRLELAEIDGPNRSGYVRLRFRMVVDGVAVGEARATVRGRLRGPALVAERVLRRGEVVGADDVRAEDMDLTGLAAPPLRSAEEALGTVPRRTLTPGRVLTADLFGPAPVVFTGQSVDLLFRREQLTVKARGTALSDGAPGDIVPVENSSTSTRLHGKVLDDGSLLVVRGAGPRRNGR